MKHYEELKVPINIAQGLKKKGYMTVGRTLTGIVFGVVYIFGVILLIKFNMFNEVGNNVLRGFLGIVLYTLIILKLMRVLVFQEKYLKKIYKTLQENKNKDIDSILSIYTKEVVNNVPVWFLESGDCMVGIKLTNEAIIGYNSKSEINLHELKVADALKEADRKFMEVKHINIMDTISVDTRWEKLLDKSSKCDIEILKLMVSSIAEYNMEYKAYDTYDYYFFISNPAYKALRSIVHDAIYVANMFTLAKYRSYSFVDSEDIENIIYGLFGIQSNLEKALSSENVNMEDAAEMVRVLEVYEGTNKRMISHPFGHEETTHKAKKRSNRHG